jgi:hypothetical protein
MNSHFFKPFTWLTIFITLTILSIVFNPIIGTNSYFFKKLRNFSLYPPGMSNIQTHKHCLGHKIHLFFRMPVENKFHALNIFQTGIKHLLSNLLHLEKYIDLCK